MNAVQLILSVIEHGIDLLLSVLEKKSDAQLTSETLARLADITDKLAHLDETEKAEQDELDAAVPPA